MQEFIPWVAIILSLFSIVGTFWFNRRLLGVRGLSNLANLIALERSIAEIPTVFRFHGISAGDIKQAGITPEELAYLVASVTAGGVYHRTVNPGSLKPFLSGTYRHTMCCNEEFRKAWPLVKRMMNESDFTKRIDETIKHACNEG